MPTKKYRPMAVKMRRPSLAQETFTHRQAISIPTCFSTYGNGCCSGFAPDFLIPELHLLVKPDLRFRGCRRFYSFGGILAPFIKFVNTKIKNEVTLDCIDRFTTKGHFCSILVSNIL